MIKNFHQVTTVFQKTFEEENQGRVLLQTRQREGRFLRTMHNPVCRAFEDSKPPE